MDSFQLKLMEQILLDHRAILTAETAELYSTELYRTSLITSILCKKLFYKIAKGSFIRQEATITFMNAMLTRSW